MDSKRKSRHEGNESDKILAQHSKRTREDSQQADTCVIRFGKLRSVLHIKNDIEPHLTNFFQRVVHEEVERILVPRPSGAKFFELVFKNVLPATIYTHSKIKAEDGRPVEIALWDIRSQSIVTDGPLSSIKIKICVLKGEFGSTDWNTDEFKANISRERENKGKLLKGDEAIALNNGMGHISNIMFTDNSKRTRSRHFRLGAIVLSTSNEANIKEAISNRFMVKDSRGESKHYPPSLNDEVWRLKHISKDGKVHKRLSDELRIKTVKDLLQQYETRPSLLREKFGKNSKKLHETIKHAKTYNPDVTSNGQNWRSQNILDFDEKRLVEMVERQAYNNLKDLKPIEPISHDIVRTLATVQCGAPDQGLQHFYLPNAQQGQQAQMFLPYLSQPSTSTTLQHIDEAALRDQVGSSQLPQLAEMQLGWSAGEQLIAGAYIGDIGSQIDQFTFPPTAWEPVDPFLYNHGAESSNPFLNSAVYISRKGKWKTLWRKIRNVLKLVIPHAAKRKA